MPPYGPLDVPPLDPTAVHLLGYSMGSIIAYACLLPQIFASPPSASGRPSRRARGGGGLRWLYETHALLRLGR